jgi:hypothetical protein
MSNQVTTRKGLSVKDLVTTGIFTALLFVFTMVGGVFLQQILCLHSLCQQAAHCFAAQFIC